MFQELLRAREGMKGQPSCCGGGGGGEGQVGAEVKLLAGLNTVMSMTQPMTGCCASEEEMTIMEGPNEDVVGYLYLQR